MTLFSPPHPEAWIGTPALWIVGKGVRGWGGAWVSHGPWVMAAAVLSLSNKVVGNDRGQPVALVTNEEAMSQSC